LSWNDLVRIDGEGKYKVKVSQEDVGEVNGRTHCVFLKTTIQRVEYLIQNKDWPGRNMRIVSFGFAYKS